MTKLFNNFNLSNEEIESILLYFNDYIKSTICKKTGKNNKDYEQNIKLEIIKTLSKNKKFWKNLKKIDLKRNIYNRGVSLAPIKYITKNRALLYSIVMPKKC